MYDEILNVIDEADLSVTSAVVEMYSKALMLESFGISIDENSFFQEGSTPERKTILEKVVMFIPDMIRKLIEFIKKKLRKLFGKKPKEMTEAIAETITGTKHDDTKKKKVIAAFAAVGLAAVATAAGFKIYDKHNKQILTIEVGDNTSECDIKVEYDLPHMIEGLQASAKIVDELYKLYTISDKAHYQKQYKTFIKDINDATHSMKLAVSKTIEDKKYTIQSLLKELKTLETITDKLGNVKTMTNISGISFKSTETKYEQNAVELNQAISEWIKEFNKFTADISVFLGYINASIELLCRDMYDNGLGSTAAFGYLKGLITYCSYQSSAKGFQFSTIVDPWQKSEENIAPSASANKSFGKTFDICDKIFSHQSGPFAWGSCENNWFVLTKDRYKHYDVIGTDGSKHDDTYENFAFIFGSPEQFTKTAHFFLNTPRSVIERITTGMMTPTQADDDNPSGILINRDILGKLINFTQKSATGLQEDLIPKNEEVFLTVTNSDKNYLEEGLLSNIKRVFPNATLSPIKGRKNIYKISLNGDSSGSSSNKKISKEDALQMMEVLEAVYRISHSDEIYNGSSIITEDKVRNQYFFMGISLAKAFYHNDPAVEKLVSMVLPDLKLPEDHSHDDVLDYDTEINDAIDVFLKQKGHASTADLAVDNLLDQYGTPELAEQGTNTVTFQQLCDLVIKNKDVILANISKS